MRTFDNLSNTEKVAATLAVLKKPATGDSVISLADVPRPKKGSNESKSLWGMLWLYRFAPQRDRSWTYYIPEEKRPEIFQRLGIEQAVVRDHFQSRIEKEMSRVWWIFENARRQRQGLPPLPVDGIDKGRKGSIIQTNRERVIVIALETGEEWRI